ncbi:MAG: hypothetical protein HC896_08275 [Bacteroidales bacterium]|nr:hypothetical protein [Bacteroidales bacterium]
MINNELVQEQIEKTVETVDRPQPQNIPNEKMHQPNKRLISLLLLIYLVIVTILAVLLKMNGNKENTPADYKIDSYFFMPVK